MELHGEASGWGVFRHQRGGVRRSFRRRPSVTVPGVTLLSHGQGRGVALSRGWPLSYRKGSRSAGHRPECLSSNRFRRSPIAPRGRYPEARGAEPCSGLAALKPPTGGPGQRTPVPDRERVTARLLLRQPSRHVVFVFQARPAPETRSLVQKDRRRSFPLDRPPPPHRSLAMRPFHATR